MKPISVYRPSSVEEAIDPFASTQAGVYAGGTDLLIQLKNRIEATPSFLVDIKKIDGLRRIKEDGQGGVQIGALSRRVRFAGEEVPLLVTAVQKISSPELRNASTVGGDILQQVWFQCCMGATPAIAMAATSVTARSGTTATPTRQWAAGYANAV